MKIRELDSIHEFAAAVSFAHETRPSEREYYVDLSVASGVDTDTGQEILSVRARAAKRGNRAVYTMAATEVYDIEPSSDAGLQEQERAIRSLASVHDTAARLQGLLYPGIEVFLALPGHEMPVSFERASAEIAATLGALGEFPAFSRQPYHRRPAG